MTDTPASATTTADEAVRLSQGSAAYRSPPEFYPGDTVRLARFTHTSQVMREGASSIGNVLEVVPSLREFSGNLAACIGPGILVAFVCIDGTIATQWVGAWLYELAPPDHIRGGAPLHG